MSIALRILLIVGSILTFVFILRKIRKCQLEIGDAIFWFIFAFALIVIAVFPYFIIAPAAWIGVDSPVNFLFLIIIFILAIKQFLMTLQIASLKSAMRTLTQTEALHAKEEYERGEGE